MSSSRKRPFEDTTSENAQDAGQETAVQLADAMQVDDDASAASVTDAGASGTDATTADDQPSSKKRKEHNIKSNDSYEKLKYAFYLPAHIKKNVDQEIATLKSEFMGAFRRFFGSKQQGWTEEEVVLLLNSRQKIDELDTILSLFHRYLELKYPLEKDEKIEILHYLFPVASTINVDFAIQTRVCLTCCDLIKKRHKETLNVTFPWRPLYQLIDHVYFTKFRSTLFPPNDHANAVVSLVRKLKRYFTRESAQEIIAEFKPMMCINDQLLFKAQAYLCAFLPTDASSAPIDWFAWFMSVWDWNGLYPTWDQQFIEVFSNLAEHNPGAIDWEPHLPLIFSKVLRAMELPVGNAAPPSMYDEMPMNEVSIFYSFELSKNMLLLNAGKLIVWMITKNSSCMSRLKQLIKSAELFFHPGNEGSYSGPLADFLLSLAHMFCKRFEYQRAGKILNQDKLPAEYLLTEEQVREFASMLIPIALKAQFSKSKQNSIAGQHLLKHFSYIVPDLVFPPLMEQVSHALATLTETHQTSAAFETLAIVLPPMLDRRVYPEGQKYLTDLLMMTIPGIDPNDLKKTYACLTFVSSLLACIPLFSERSTDDAPDVLHIIEDWCLQLLDRLFQILSNQHSVEEGKTDGLDADTFWGLTDIFFDQLSPELHEVCMRKVYEFVQSNFLPNAKKNMGHLCSSCSFTNPKAALSMFVPMLYNKIVDERTGNLKNLTPLELSYYVHLMAQVLISTGLELLKYKAQIHKVIELAWAHEDKTVVKAVGKLIRNVLRSTSFYYIKDSRCVNPSMWNSEEYQKRHYLYWGHFPSARELEVSWHVPSKEELDFACEVVNQHLTKVLNRVKEYTELLKQNANSNPSLSKNARHALILLNYLLRSCSTMFGEITNGLKKEFNRYPSGMLRVEAGLGLCAEEGRLQIGYETISNALAELTEVLLSKSKDLQPEPKLLLKLIKSIYPIFCVRGGETNAGYKQRLQSVSVIKQHSCVNYSVTRNKYPRFLLINNVTMRMRLRSVLHCESIDYAEAYHRLISNLVTLSLSTYSDVRQAALDVLMASVNKFSTNVLDQFLPDVIRVISDTSASDEAITGACYFIERPSSFRCILLNWKLMSQLMLALCHTSHVEKQLVQDRLMELYEVYFASYYQTTMDAEGRQQYEKLINDMLDLAERTPNMHWKYFMMISSLFTLLIRNDSSESRRIMFPVRGVVWLFKQLVSDVANLRYIAIEATSLLFAQYKPIQPRKLVQLDTNKAMFNGWRHVKQPTTREEWQQTRFFDKNWFGWYSFPREIKSYIYNPSELSENTAVDRTQEARVQLVSQLREIMTADFLRKFFELSIVREDVFNDGNAQFYKGLFQIFGEDFWNAVKPHLDDMLTWCGNGKQEEINVMSTASELIAGALKGMKHWDFEAQQRANNDIAQRLDKAIDQCSNNCVMEWCDALEFIAADCDPRRVGWLRDLLLRKVENSLHVGTSSSDQLRHIRSLYSLVGELNWRESATLEKIGKMLLDQLSHPYQQVRVHISLFLSFICKITWSPPRDPTSDLPKSDVLSHGIPADQQSALMSWTTTQLWEQDKESSVPATIETIFKTIEREVEKLKELGSSKKASGSTPSSATSSPISSGASGMASISPNALMNMMLGQLASPHSASAAAAQLKAALRQMGSQQEGGDAEGDEDDDDEDAEMGEAGQESQQQDEFSAATSSRGVRGRRKDRRTFQRKFVGGATDLATPAKLKIPQRALGGLGSATQSKTPTFTSPNMQANISDMFAQQPQESNAFKSICRTVLALFGSIFSQNSPNTLVPYTTRVLSLLKTIQEHCDDEEILDMARESVMFVSTYPFSRGLARMVLNYLKDSYFKSSNWKVRSGLLDFIQVFGFLQQYNLGDEDRESLFDLIQQLMRDPQFEVREIAAETMSGFLKMSDQSFVEQKAQTFVQWAGEPVAPKRRARGAKKAQAATPASGDEASAATTPAATDEDIIRHSGVLGIAAVVLSNPFEIPDYAVPLLVRLAKFSNDSSQSIRDTVRKAFSIFWKTISDTFPLYKDKFTEEQLLTLTDLLVSPSYFA